MKKLSGWIKDHQLISFFLITFLITWGLGFSYSAVMNQGKFLMAPLVFIATCGPALAGISITIIAGSKKKHEGNRLKSWIIFFVSWVIALAVCLANLAFINKLPLSPMLIVIVIVMVLPVAFIINLIYTRFPVIRNFQIILIRARENFRWILFALILMPALCLISILISNLLGRSTNPFSVLPATGIALIGWILVKFLYQFFFFNGTGEEVGWRGFALPRFQLRVSPLLAALLLALIWVPWHYFLWQAEGRAINTFSFWYSSYLIHIPSSVIVCWIFNRSKGSILIAGITHASANTIMAMLGGWDITVLAITLYVFVIIIIFTDRMWRKLPEGHEAVYKK
ncbi:MAG: CPBP family glutamic-type intramembrane protease [bacterium]